MEQLLAHLLGDFIVQNHWMANRKTQVSWIAALHAALYGLGFLVVYWTIIQVDTLRFGGSDLSVPSWAALAVIVGTHFVIDRWRLARVITNIWGTGKPGVIMPFVARMAGVMEGRGSAAEKAFLPPEESPAWLTVWLLFIVDNIGHLALNFAALRWL